MATMSNLDETRILRGAINVGDYIRIGNGNASMRDQWWRVTGRRSPSAPGQPDRVDLINAAGVTRTGYALNQWDKIIRHPYSQRHPNG